MKTILVTGGANGLGDEGRLEPGRFAAEVSVIRNFLITGARRR